MWIQRADPRNIGTASPGVPGRSSPTGSDENIRATSSTPCEGEAIGMNGCGGGGSGATRTVGVGAWPEDSEGTSRGELPASTNGGPDSCSTMIDGGRAA